MACIISSRYDRIFPFGAFILKFLVSNFSNCVQEPNYEDPLNHDAAAVLRENPKVFESNVRRAMTGGYVGTTFFPRCM